VRASTPTRQGVPADQTGIRFTPFQLKQFGPPPEYAIQPAPVPEELQGAVNQAGQLDLTRVTPEMMAAMDPQERKAFLELLGQQGSTGAYPGYPESQNASTNIMGLDQAFALHLLRQDPTGATAADLFATNPDLLVGVHRAITAGSAPLREEANNLALTLFGNLDRSFADTEMSAEHARALKSLTTEHMQVNGHSPEAFAQLLAAGDEAAGRMPPETAHFNSGVLAASVLAGVRDSGEAPFEALASWPGRWNVPGIVSSILLNAANRVVNTKDEAALNYNSLYDAIVAGYNDQRRAAGNDPAALRVALEEHDGFINGMSWLR